MTESDLADAVEGVRGVRVRNMAFLGWQTLWLPCHVSIRFQEVRVRICHTFWSWFCPGLRQRRRRRVRDAINVVRPWYMRIDVTE